MHMHTRKGHSSLFFGRTLLVQQELFPLGTRAARCIKPTCAVGFASWMFNLKLEAILPTKQVGFVV
jgi:hypothetical protein